MLVLRLFALILALLFQTAVASNAPDFSLAVPPAISASQSSSQTSKANLFPAFM